MERIRRDVWYRYGGNVFYTNLENPDKIDRDKATPSEEQIDQRKKFANAVSVCKGQTRNDFLNCMSKELKK